MYNIKTLAKKYFPFDAYNPGQEAAIVKTVQAVLDGKKHIILQAPTGIGKSAIATTVHRVLHEIQGRWRTTIITSTKGLQDQYEQTDDEIYSLKGKTNYECPLGHTHYNTSGCRMALSESVCDRARICPYFKRRKHWCNVADLRLTNTSFQIEACSMLVTTPETIADMIVVDECHDIDEQLVSHTTLRIEIEALEHLKKVTPAAFLNEFTEFINYFMDMPAGTAFVINDEVSKAASRLLTKIEAELEDIEERISQKKGHIESLHGATEELQQFVDKLTLFNNQNGEWMVTEYGFSTLVELKPIYAYQVANYGLFRKATYFLHMSATICGFESYMETLGIKEEECFYMDIPNPIPLENRKVFALSRVKVSGDFDRDRVTELIDKIAERHGQANGIVHTVSFQLAKEILERSRFADRMVISNNRDEILSLLGDHNSGKIVLSPSIEKGYDFKGDMCRWQVLPKVPFYYIGDKWIKLNMERDPTWYARKAILRLVQASGRAVRGVDDHASTYIIDSNFDRLFKYNKSLFPDWYLKSVVMK